MATMRFRAHETFFIRKGYEKFYDWSENTSD